MADTDNNENENEENGTPNGAPADGTQEGTPTPPPPADPLLADLQGKFAQATADLTAAQQKVKELERAKLDENERTKAENKDLQDALEKAQKALEERAIENAFLVNNKVTWQNPATALRLLAREGLKVKDDGTVDGIEAAITALSKSDPYLVKSESGKGGSGGGTGSTGSQPGTGGGSKDNAAADRSKLEKKYPAIRR